MPQIGEVRTGTKDRRIQVWAACSTCGRLRWVNKNLIEAGRGQHCRACSSRIASRHPRIRLGCIPSTERILDGGYVFIRLDRSDPMWPMAKARRYFVAKHRLVMARSLGRCLTESEIVHHVNCVRTDNRLENLRIVTRSDHSRAYGKAELQRRIRQLEWQVKHLNAEMRQLKEALQLKLKVVA